MPDALTAAPFLPTGTDRLRWGELYGSSPAFFIAQAAVASAPLVISRSRDTPL
jgi:hypothetical protein